jgi:hypothetical protein
LKEAALTARTGGARPEDRYLAFRRRAIDLLDDGRIVAAEIYPAEIYSHVGLSRTFGKTSRQGRRGEANSILSWCARNAAAVPVDLAVQIEDGFGDDDAGEDRFDSFIGALGMMEAVAGLAGSTVPDDPAVRNVEGWIPGMRISPVRAAVKPVRTRAAKQQAKHPSGPDRGKAGRSELWGWDRARWPGVVGATPGERKRIYRDRYAG